MTVSLCFASQVTVENTHAATAGEPILNQEVVPTINPQPESPPAKQEYSQECIVAMADYETYTVQQSQSKLLMDQAQNKLNSVNPLDFFSKPNHQTALNANKRIFDQSTKDVTKSLVKIYDHCGKDFDVFLDEVRQKINEYVIQSLKESNLNP